MRALFILPLLFLLGACDAEQADKSLQGYVEGQKLNLAPPCATGRITALYVDEGDQVTAGTILFAIDSERVQARLDEAIATKAAAVARLKNREKGGRPDEIRAATESLKVAEASFTLAEQTYKRSKILVDKGIVAAERLDHDQATLDTAKARIIEAQARLDLIRLPARDDVIAAAEREVEAYSAAIIRARVDLKDCSVAAPSSGRIEDIYRRVGEIAGPTLPVLALLPPEQMRVRFFVPEPMLPRILLGGAVTILCDNCQEGLQGKITFISDQAEFTPPVIFTEKEREKLVYLVEAHPDKPEYFLNGQPVNIILP